MHGQTNPNGCLLQESHGRHKSIVLIECWVFSVKHGGRYSYRQASKFFTSNTWESLRTHSRGM